MRAAVVVPMTFPCSVHLTTDTAIRGCSEPGEVRCRTARYAPTLTLLARERCRVARQSGAIQLEGLLPRARSPEREFPP